VLAGPNDMLSAMPASAENFDQIIHIIGFVFDFTSRFNYSAFQKGDQDHCELKDKGFCQNCGLGGRENNILKSFKKNQFSQGILIFARYPVPGKVKTRLIPEIGPVAAARLQRRMTEHVVNKARRTRDAFPKGDIVITLFCTGGKLKDFRSWLGVDLEYVLQPSGDIGRRMEWGFDWAFSRGRRCALAVGSDLPWLSKKILIQAFDNLGKSDVVLGPAVDGGYYLIGMSRLYGELFSAMEWSTKTVAAQTRQALVRLGLTFTELSILNDVDCPEDLVKLRNIPGFKDIFNGKPMISVIIPALNEASKIGETLELVNCGDMIEIIVTDGGSRDKTRKIAAEKGAVVLDVSPGRALQMNAGAGRAKGTILLFLHADTRLPSGYDDLIRFTMDSPSVVAGAFKFRTDGKGFAMDLVERGTNLRSSLFQLPYGDQGLFMEKRVFDEEKGFTLLPIMEDFDLVRRLRRRGSVVTLSSAAVTSARRWQKLGVVLTTLLNQIMITGFLLGLPLGRLKRLYGDATRISIFNRK